VLGLIRANLFRRRARTLLTATGIAVGVATIVALLALTQGIENSARGLIHLGKADLGLFQRDVSDPTASVLPVGLADRVAREPGVAEATPIQLVVEAVPRSPSSLIFGIAPGGFVSRRLVVTAGRRPRGQEVAIGDELADRLGVHAGDALKLKGRRVPVVGVYHSGVTFEDDGLVAPLAFAQALARQPRGATTVAVALMPRARLSTVAHRLERRFPGTITITNPEQAARSSTSFQIVRKAALVIALLALVIGAISVTNTMLLAVLERQGELALLAAVGFGPGRVAVLILGEGVGVSLLGAGLGLGLGVAAGELVVRAFSANAFVSPDVTAWGLGRGLIVGIAIGVLGGVYPAWRVTRLAPAAALARR
jgi:putative ABC transport system permease protein